MIFSCIRKLYNTIRQIICLFLFILNIKVVQYSKIGDTMKKIITSILLTIMVPYMIVNLYVKDEEIKFYYVSNKTVRVKQEATGEIIVVPFEEYVKGVLAGEMPISFEKEALKAQAVAARSYVLKKMESSANSEYDVVDSVMNQVYLDDEMLKNRWQDSYEEKNNKLKEIIAETRGEYLTYNGEVAEAFFFSTSTGKTENSGEVFMTQLPYLQSVDSSWDAEVSPVFTDTEEFSVLDFCTRLGILYESPITFEVTETTSTGRIKKIKINNKEFTGNEITSTLKLRSTYFEINQVGNNIVINTKGYGHGVGMSQYGALAMAKRGYTYDEILKYYYQGVEISKL